MEQFLQEAFQLCRVLDPEAPKKATTEKRQKQGRGQRADGADRAEDQANPLYSSEGSKGPDNQQKKDRDEHTFLSFAEEPPTRMGGDIPSASQAKRKNSEEAIIVEVGTLTPCLH